MPKSSLTQQCPLQPDADFWSPAPSTIMGVCLETKRNLPCTPVTYTHDNLLPIFTLSNLLLPSSLIRVSDPTFVQMRDDVFLNMIKPVEPLKSAGQFDHKKKNKLVINQHKIRNIDTCSMYIDHKLCYTTIRV